MYAEQVFTPHETLTAPGQTRVPLTDAAAVNPWQSQDKQAEHIQQAVRSSLRITQANALPDGENVFDSLSERQETDCYGYATVGSELFDQIHIPHYIAYANGHAFLVRLDESETPYMTDMMLPQFNQSLDGITADSILATKEAMCTNGRMAVKLYADKLCTKVKGTQDDLVLRHPWLKAGRQKQIPLYIGREERHNAYNLIMSLYQPAQGRDVLEDHSRMQTALRQHHYDRAAAYLMQMHGLYPDLDARNPHSELKGLVRGLVGQHAVDLAFQATESYFASFTIGHDGRPNIAHGDALRYIARHSGDREHLEKALAEYRIAEERCRGWRPLIAGKIATIQSLLQRTGQPTVLDLAAKANYTSERHYA